MLVVVVVVTPANCCASGVVPMEHRKGGGGCWWKPNVRFFRFHFRFNVPGHADHDEVVWAYRELGTWDFGMR